MAGGIGPAGLDGGNGRGQLVVDAHDWRDSVKRKDLLTGLMLIGIGLIFLASNVGPMPEINVARMWPLLLAGIGLIKILAPGGDSRWDGMSLILIAGIFLAHNYRVMRIHDSWPLFIVLAGLTVMFGTRHRKVLGKVEANKP
jgi:hypothetical protein